MREVSHRLGINLLDEHKRRDNICYDFWQQQATLSSPLCASSERWGGVGVAPFKRPRSLLRAALCWVLIRVFIYIHLCVCPASYFFRLAGEENYARDYVCEACSLSLRCASGARARSPLGRRRRCRRSFSTPAHSFFCDGKPKADDHAE